MKLKWSFSIILGAAYLAMFHLWLVIDPRWVRASGLMGFALLTVLFICAARRGEFLNLWDGLTHAVVILDILLEGVFIKLHEHYGFYLCAAAFAVVLVGYRLWWQRGNRELTVA